MQKAAIPALVVLAVVLLTSGCSDDGDTSPSGTSDGKKIVASMKAALPSAALAVGTEDATCIAKRFVDAVGTQKLVEAQVVSPAFQYTAGTAEKSELAPEFTAARGHCLEEKAALSIAPAITTADGLITKPKDAACVARDFAHAVGLDRLIAGQVVDTAFTYVPNGALQDAGNARAYGDAVLRCLGQEPALATLKGVVEAGYASKSIALAAPYAACFLPKFADSTGVSGLFANRFVSDKGEYAYEGRVYDKADATALAGFILGCVDTLKLDAESAAAKDEDLDAAKLEACAKKAITPEFLRDKFLANQLLGKVSRAESASRTSAAAFQRCVDAQKG